MLRISVFILLCLFGMESFSQKKVSSYHTVDSLVLTIPKQETVSMDAIAAFIDRNFSTEEDKLRAIYVWVAKNLSYDESLLNDRRYQETPDALLQEALKNRRGVCFHYAGIFQNLSSKCGLRSYWITGYCKKFGKLILADSHAWVSAQIGGKWYLFDPTWGSGYQDKGRYVSRFDETYFKVSPREQIKTHMPFDPLWQFLDYPLKYEEFDAAVVNREDSVYFNWNDTLKLYNNSDEKERLLVSNRRIKANGLFNKVVKEEYDLNQSNLLVLHENEMIKQYNEAVFLFNKSVEQLNAFITYRNLLFTPKKEETTVRSMLEQPMKGLKKSEKLLEEIFTGRDELREQIASLKIQVMNATEAVAGYQSFLDKYYTTPILLRKTLFMK